VAATPGSMPDRAQREKRRNLSTLPIQFELCWLVGFPILLRCHFKTVRGQRRACGSDICCTGLSQLWPGYSALLRMIQRCQAPETWPHAERPSDPDTETAARTAARWGFARHGRR
jgi:hypothetical protein